MSCTQALVQAQLCFREDSSSGAVATPALAQQADMPPSRATSGSDTSESAQHHSRIADAASISGHTRCRRKRDLVFVPWLNTVRAFGSSDARATSGCCGQATAQCRRYRCNRRKIDEAIRVHISAKQHAWQQVYSAHTITHHAQHRFQHRHPCLYRRRHHNLQATKILERILADRGGGAPTMTAPVGAFVFPFYMRKQN
jgi:hypothetical protein